MSTNPRKNPFKGLQPFELEDQDRLFGRERDLILIKDRILSCRTTLLFAGSGVGKTSFLNAAVIPELSKRYSVVWHNRWTGADERSDEHLWDDRPPFKRWPPKAFATWLADALLERVWHRRKLDSKSNIETKKAAKVQDKFTVDVQDAISQNLKPGNSTPLSSVLSVFKKDPESNVRPKGCMLILDQFEEVFQYHAYQDYFDDFLANLCEIINDDDYQVRVVFSMREEFLGELSAFDNRIPDLFNNYYRLRYPKTDEAKHIIAATCRLAKVEPHPENLDKLVKDLSTIEKNFDQPTNTAEAEAPSVRVMRRDFVPPPYLQIVCDSLWREQYKSPETSDVGEENGGAQNEIGRFLENYKTLSELPVQGEESDAQRAVREFCEAKLSPPFLNKWEQSLAARAFGFLVTKQGAKMAYELRSLASHMDERVSALKQTLQKLSRPDAHILRESRGPEGSYWFELYHDMYAGVVDRWKRRYRQERRRQERLNLIVYSGLVAYLLLLIGGFIYYARARPEDNKEVLAKFIANLNTTDIQSDSGYIAAVQAYSRLRETLGYSGIADSLWAQVWLRRGELHQAKEEREEALLSLLQAASLAKGSPAERDYLAQANNLFADDEDAIKATFCTDCRFARVSPDGSSLATIGAEGDLVVWNAAKRTTVCSDCSQAQFSSDSRLVGSVGLLTEEPPRNTSGTSRRRFHQRAPASPQSAADASSSVGSDTASSPTSTPTPTPTPKIIGWEVQISHISPSEAFMSVSFDIKARQSVDKNPQMEQITDDETSELDFRLKAISKGPIGYLVAGVLYDELTIWRDNQTAEAQVLPIKSGLLTFDRSDVAQLLASFSPDGKYFVAGTMSIPAQFWDITAEGLSPSKKITNLSAGRNFGFSTDGRYFLAESDDGYIRLWELASQTEVLKIAVPEKRLTRIGFAVGSGKFFVASRNGSITVWDSDSRKSLFQPVTPDRPGTAMLLDSEGKTIIRRILGRYRVVFDKWSFETGKKVGELNLKGLVRTPYLTSKGSLVVSSGSSVRVWDIPPPKSYETFTETPTETSFFGRLSNDGNVMLSFEGDRRGKPSVFRLWDVPTRTRIFSESIEQRGFSMSPDALRIAVIPRTGNVLTVFDRTRSDSPRKLPFEEQIATTSFSPDNKILAVATVNKAVQLIDTTSYLPTKTLKSETFNASLTFAPSNRFLIIRDSQEPFSFDDPDEFSEEASKTPLAIEAWSITNGEKIALNVDLKEFVQTSDMSNDERLLIVQNKKISILDLSNGARVNDFPYDKESSVAKFTPDGKSVITCDKQGELQMWDVTQGKRGPSLTIGDAGEEIVFSSDGLSFVVVTNSWIHRITIGTQGLRYGQGIHTGILEPSSVRLLSTVDSTPESPTYSVRWFDDSILGLHAQTASFGRASGKSVLQGDASTLLTDWQTRLGFSMNSLGYLSRELPDVRDLKAGPSPADR